MSYDGLLGTLIVNRDDAVLSAFVIQPERSKDVSYTPSYFNAGVVLVTRVEQDGILLNNLANKTLSAEYGSEGDALIRKWSRVTVGLKALPMKDSIGAMQAVEQGKADGALVDAVSAYQYISRGDVPRNVFTNDRRPCSRSRRALCDGGFDQEPDLCCANCLVRWMEIK